MGYRFSEIRREGQDENIAKQINRRGFRTPEGNKWNRESVKSVIKDFRKETINKQEASDDE